MLSWGWRSLLFISTLFLVLSSALPGSATAVLAQFPTAAGGGSSAYSLGWVELDGYDTFQISAPGAALGQRRQQIHQNLEEIRDDYLALEDPVANVTTSQTENGQTKVYVNDQYLMTITSEDTNLQGMTTEGLVEHLKDVIPETLERAYRQRQPEYRRQQFVQIGVALALAVGGMVVLQYASERLVRSTIRRLGPSLNQANTTDNQRHQVHDLRDRLLPLVQGLVLASTLLWAMGPFPELRVIQQELLSTLKVPIIIGIVVVVAYVGIRLTYTVVDRLALGLTDEAGFSSHYSRRARLRISTLSSVIKNITNFVWIAIGFLVALSITGVDIGLLLASVGLIGLALSLAAQNLVKGAIQGFFIVLEDQFAIGDVVKIGDDSGVVEKLNLRITQLRDTAGRLITIPTSDINRVANYSLHWSQADLKIPVHYNADINHMLEVTRQVGGDLQHDPDWSPLILDDPQILGVDDFGDSSLIIRVWIKTQPMKQWDVSREYRRRFKLAVQEAGTDIPFPQRDVWLHPSDEFRLTLQGALNDGHSPNQAGQNGNGRQAQARTDAQPPNAPDDYDGAATAREA
ncbi:mechanosensitive ion channel family protein [Nodosilinea sp. AN01ver1]|uniref:mechanosensitive ion channel family protein n=1 Tax=Nodosilinea sp. AN01ver1 TaxID=3423362 RepID=UPI003D31980C